MKMPNHEYQQLKADFLTIVQAFELEAKNFEGEDEPHHAPNLSPLWDMMRRINFERSHDDTHPTFSTGYIRVLPFTYFSPLDKFYSMGLHDSHIETALKQIYKELDLS